MSEADDIRRLFHDVTELRSLIRDVSDRFDEGFHAHTLLIAGLASLLIRRGHLDLEATCGALEVMLDGYVRSRQADSRPWDRLLEVGQQMIEMIRVTAGTEPRQQG